MSTMDKGSFGNWLENRYLDWQKQQGGRRSIREFSDWLEFDHALVVRWMNGQRKPGYENACSLAEKLNSLEIFDTLGFQRPNPVLFRLYMRMKRNDLPEGAIQRLDEVLNAEEAAEAARHAEKQKPAKSKDRKAAA